MAPRWDELIASSSGEYVLNARLIGTNVSLAHRAQAQVESASTIKLPLLLALLDAVQRHRYSLRRRIDVKRRHVGRNGSGLLQSMYFNTPFTLYNLAFLMMSVSDNVATNVIIELLGKPAINRYFQDELGLTQTRLVMEVIDFPATYSTERDGPMGLTTPFEMAGLIERLLAGKILDPYHTRLALRFMSHVTGSNALRQLPPRRLKRFGSKTGRIVMTKDHCITLNECGFIETKTGHLITFAIFSTLSQDRELPGSLDSSEVLEFTRVARAVYDGLEDTVKRL